MKLILLFNLIVSFNTWITPSPMYAQGKIVNYGSYDTILATAKYNGYDLIGYKGGVSLISPSDIGKIVWIKDKKGEWQGAFLAVDIAKQRDFYTIVYEYEEVIEVPKVLLNVLELPDVSYGEIYINPCHPSEYEVEKYPQKYKPELEWHKGEFIEMIYQYPLPKQEQMIDCR